MLTGSDLLTIEHTIQLAIAPAFVLGSIMAVINLLIARLQRLSDRAVELRDGKPGLPDEDRLLRRRTRAIFSAITASIVAAVFICLLVIVSFLEPVFGLRAGFHLAGLLVSGMAALTVALSLFLFEVLLSARTLPHRADP